MISSDSPITALLRKILLFLFIPIALISCEQQPEETKEAAVVNIITETMDFQMPDTIRSGWQTFHYENRSYETHFFLLDKYPAGKTIEDGEREIMPPFQEGMDLINAGKPEEAFAAFGKLPEWFGQVVFCGGSGLISPGKTSVTTLKLEPGYYVVECYVKMQNGMFHSVMGMVKELIVLPDTTTHAPPKPDVWITISGTEGINMEGRVRQGHQVFSVHFRDQIVHENFVGHDVNLVRLDETADPEVLESWMNWSVPGGLQTPSPEGVTFLGGVNDMPAEGIAYFEAEISPGRYAFIAEVPDAVSKNMFRTFTVTEQE